MKVAIVGAGPGGLVSAKYCLSEGYSVDIFEQNRSIGGVWVYSDHQEFDEDGFPVQAAMYKGLKTNVPKELMEFSDFPYPKEIQGSYLPAELVLQYFNNYADTFNLRPLVKLQTKVTEVLPMDGEKWLVKALDLKQNSIISDIYDVIIIANGHHGEKIIPMIPGKETFTGIQLHSKDFRTASVFQNKRCLVVGMGLSGQDVSKLLLAVTDKVIVSYKPDNNLETLPTNLIKKPCISSIKGNRVFFDDDTSEEVDVIIYCTGYKYSFPFLKKECGIVVENNKWVRPLYKEIINIEHPTMCFIGLQYYLPVIAMFDLQARFFISTLNGHFPLPSKSSMYDDYEKDLFQRQKLGIPLKHSHGKVIEELRKEYYEDLANTANIARIPPVILNMFEKILADRMKGEYRHITYKIISDTKFKMIMNGEKDFKDKSLVNDSEVKKPVFVDSRKL